MPVAYTPAEIHGLAPLRIAHAAARLPVGGMELVIRNLVRSLSSQCACEVWCLEELDAVGHELHREGFPVRNFHKRSSRDPLLLFRLARALRRQRIDILHCHDELSWFYGTIAARIARRPRVVVTMHGRRRGISKRHLAEQRLLAKATDEIIAVSHYLARQLVDELSLEQGKLRTITNGISLAATVPDARAVARARRLLGLGEDHFVVGTVGELSAVKNLTLALDAISRVRNVVPGIRYVLIGDGALRDALSQYASELHIDGLVRFAGIRRDIPEVLPAFDAYLCSSAYEGVSLSILEAMMMARAIVATAVGGNPEVLRGGEAGLLVPTGDAQQMADALVRLSESATLRSRLGERARDAVMADFALERMRREYERMYLNVCRLPRL